MAKTSAKNDLKINLFLKSLAKTSIFVVLILFFSKLLTYIYRVLVARYFGPEVYGLFSLSIMILGLFVTVSSIGLVDGLIRFIALYRGKKEENKIRYLLKFSSVILLVSGLVSGFLLFILSDSIAANIFNNSALSFYLKVFSFLIVLSLFLNFFLAILRAYEQVSEYSFLQSLFQNLVRIILLVLFIFIGFGADSAIVSSFFLSVLATIIVAYLICRHIIPDFLIKSDLNNKEKYKIRVSLLTYSWPLIFLGVISNLFGWTDSFIIGYFKTIEQVGFYNAAVPIAALIAIAPEIFMQLFFPMVTKEFTKKRYNIIRELSKQVQKWIFMINLPLLLIILIFPGVIINLLFGAEYLVAENALRILAIGTFFMSLSQASIHLLAMLGKSKTSLANVTIFSILNIILDIILIPKYGLSGAAFATAVSYSLMGLAFILQVKHEINILPFRRKMITLFIASIIPAIFLLIASKIIAITLLNLILCGAGFILIYVALIFLTGCLDKNDLMILLAIKRKVFKV